MRRSKKYIPVMIIVAVIIAAALPFLVAGHTKRTELRNLRQAEYNSVFFSMVPYRDMETDGIGEEFFAYYFALNTATASAGLRNVDDLNEYLETALNSGNTISLVTLELLPFRQGRSQNLCELIAAHPDTIFHIILAAPSMKYWTSQKEKRLEEQLASYQGLAKELLAYNNVELCFAGAEDWLIMNPGNYTAPLVTNREMTENIALLTWSDRCRLTVDNYTTVFAGLKDKINLAKTAPAPADLSDWRLVFFGDSIIGNYTDSSSIPGATAGLSGCEVYNLGIGGASACVEGDSPYSFPNVVEKFCRQETITVSEAWIGSREMAAFYEKKRDGKQICFVVNYGLNDYFNGAPVENPEDPFDTRTYAGALKSGIRKLQETFPEAVIVLAAPNYVIYFSRGQDRQSDVGGILTDYVEAAGRVAQDTDVIFMNNYYDLGIDASNSAEYLTDGCHLGDDKRFRYAQSLIRLIQNAGMGEVNDRIKER